MSEKSISEMKKDELFAFAKEKLCMELDLTRPLKELRLEVAALALAPAATTEPEKPKPKDKPISGFLKHPSNGRVYRSTLHLLSRGDMIPCNKNGAPIRAQDDE